MDGPIKQHKAMAMGKDIDGDYDGSCASPFGKGASHNDGASTKRHMKDGSRGMGPVQKHADHGPHDMHPLDHHD